jgi:hypothetical protein
MSNLISRQIKQRPYEKLLEMEPSMTTAYTLGTAETWNPTSSQMVPHSNWDFVFSDADPLTIGGFQDLEDPAALLESLASFEHSTSNESSLAVSNDHFASLLQAAGEAAAQTGHDQSRRSVSHLASQIETAADQFGNSTAHGFARRKRKRQEEDSFGFITNKHQKHGDSDSEEGYRLARDHEIWGPEDEDEDRNSPALEGQPIPTADARAIGVHSAAALFRRPSEASKKYTS